MFLTSALWFLLPKSRKDYIIDHCPSELPDIIPRINEMNLPFANQHLDHTTALPWPQRSYSLVGTCLSVDEEMICSFCPCAIAAKFLSAFEMEAFPLQIHIYPLLGQLFYLGNSLSKLCLNSSRSLYYTDYNRQLPFFPPPSAASTVSLSSCSAPGSLQPSFMNRQNKFGFFSVTGDTLSLLRGSCCS